MSQFYFKQKFPCGYEAELKVQVIIGHLVFDEEKLIPLKCPIHGNKCKMVKR